MRESARPIVRAYDGCLADAEGLLAVERATFDETPYSAGEIQSMLGRKRQRAWLACAGSEVVGFVAAFPTYGLRGPTWEIDLLAVLPEWRRRGLATELIRTASAHGADVAGQARAVVATDNTASDRAFERAGFRALQGQCKLLIKRTDEVAPPYTPISGVDVRLPSGQAEVADWLDRLQGQGQETGIDAPTVHSELENPALTPADPDQGRLSFLLAEQDGAPAGLAELVQVETLLYRGVWIESLLARTSRVRVALVQEAVLWARDDGFDEAGAMVPHEDWALQHALVAAGFRSLGDFRWFTAKLPLPVHTHRPEVIE